MYVVVDVWKTQIISYPSPFKLYILQFNFTQTLQDNNLYKLQFFEDLCNSLY